jgi:hypothetical protein
MVFTLSAVTIMVMVPLAVAFKYIKQLLFL